MPGFTPSSKATSDDLLALGADCHLILNLLYGMNKKFDHIKIFIK
jgi:hypothetical protein